MISLVPGSVVNKSDLSFINVQAFSLIVDPALGLDLGHGAPH